MKKSLLIMAATLMGTSMYAATEPTMLLDMVVTAISPDGNWAVSSDENDGKFVVIDLKNDAFYFYGGGYEDETLYSAGLGKCVSNNGIVVASGYESGIPYYWENGEWSVLPTQDTDYGAYPNAISSDGSCIAGFVSKVAMSLDDAIMAQPVMWYRNAAGGYDMYEEIDYPHTDWTGRTPQYILIDDVNADGTVCAGTLVDYSGFAQQPIVFKKDAEGKWSYTVLGNNFVNPAGVEMPPYPGEAPDAPEPQAYMDPQMAEDYTADLEAYLYRPFPEATDFMTDEELSAYYAALDAYYQDWENNPYPFIEDYMSEEERAEYNEALIAYDEWEAPDLQNYMTEEQYSAFEAAQASWMVEYEEWGEKYLVFDEAFYEVLINPESVEFEMNSTRISPNGRYVVMSALRKCEDPNSWNGYGQASTPYVFDLQDNLDYELSEGVTDVIATMVFDEGQVLGATPLDNYARNIVLSPELGAPIYTLYDYVIKHDPELKSWVDENMLHEVVSFEYIYDEATDTWIEDTVVEEKMLMGTPVAATDIYRIASWTPNTWDFTNGVSYYSYIFDLGPAVGVESVVDSKNVTVTLDHKGVLTVNGEALSVSIYDINGRMVFNTEAPVSSVKTGLNRGVYVVKAVAKDGTSVVTKASI